MGHVCAKHNEFYETACRWCETAAVPAFPAFTWTRIPVAADPTLKATEQDLSESILDRHGGCE